MRISIFLLLLFVSVSFISAGKMICIDFTIPSAPSSLSATISGQDIILNWNAATDEPNCSGVDYYVIVKNGNIALGNTSSLTYTDVNVPDGTYSYSVYAVDKVAHLGGQAIKNDVVLASPSSSSSSGGSSGGGVRTITGGNPKNSYVCSENWQCGEWSNCTNEKQTRTCIDSNSCGTSINKPAIIQECQSEKVTSTNFFTGAVTGITNFAQTGLGTGVLVGVLIICGAGIFFTVKRGKGKETLFPEVQDV